MGTDSTIKIKPKAVFKKIHESLEALRSVDYSQLTREEKDELRKELLKVRELASSIKKQMEE